MKIYSITCHDVYNSGASLQAFALQKYLTHLGHDAEIIDYKPGYLNDYVLWGRIPVKFDRAFFRSAYCIAKLPIRLKGYFGKRKKNFDLFRKKYLRITKLRFYDNAGLKHCTPLADVYFAGSDQIWNTFFKNGRDPAFYLDFAPKNATLASYAASFAAEDIAFEYRRFVKSQLERMDYISVRESSGLDILRSLGLSGYCVVDPVFLLDTKIWESMTSRITDEPYIFVYAFDGGSNMCEFTLQLAKKTGMKVYTLQKLKYGDRCFPNSGPLEFLSLIYNAEYVVSNSFHATAFSIIFHKQFWSFNRSEAINSRMHDLTKMLGLEDRMSPELSCNTDAHINYSAVDTVLKQRIDESKKYIDMVIASAK